VPDVKTVDFVQRAQERGAADEETMEEIRRVAFEEGAKAPMLARRFKSVAFPVSDQEAESKLVTQLGNTGKKLASLIAEPNLPISHEVAVQVEEAMGVLLQALEASAE